MSCLAGGVGVHARQRRRADAPRKTPHGTGVPKRMRENAQKVEVSVVLEAQFFRGLIRGTLYLRKRGASFPPVGIWHPKTTLTSEKRAFSRARNGTPGLAACARPLSASVPRKCVWRGAIPGKMRLARQFPGFSHLARLARLTFAGKTLARLILV